MRAKSKMPNRVLLVILFPQISQIDTDLFLALKNFVPLREICGHFFVCRM